jgi:hypothetical protein
MFDILSKVAYRPRLPSWAGFSEFNTKRQRRQVRGSDVAAIRWRSAGVSMRPGWLGADRCAVGLPGPCAAGGGNQVLRLRHHHQRNEQVAMWIKLTDEKQKVQSDQLGPIESLRSDGRGHRPEGGRPQGGVRAASRDLALKIGAGAHFQTNVASGRKFEMFPFGSICRSGRRSTRW